MTTFAVTIASGPKWVEGLDVRKQPLWDEHATFMDRLFDDGHVLLGGPYADGSGALVIVEMETDSPSDVRAVFETDPWVTGGVRTVADVRQWQIFLDTRNR